MGYIEKSLAGDEALIARAHLPYYYHVLAYGALILFLAAAAYLYARLQAPWSAAAAGALGFLIFLRVMLPIWTTEIGVTSERVVLKRGLLARHTDEIQLPAIEEINVHQGVLGRLLGFGYITLQGTGDDDVDLPAIAGPIGFRRSIQQALDKMHPPATAARGAPSIS